MLLTQLRLLQPITFSVAVSAAHRRAIPDHPLHFLAFKIHARFFSGCRVDDYEQLPFLIPSLPLHVALTAARRGNRIPRLPMLAHACLRGRTCVQRRRI